MKLKERLPNVFQVKFQTQEELARTFLRFEEYYQNPIFRGKVFTLENFKKWYIANSQKSKKTGKFTYYQDWDGFSLPSWVLRPFYNGEFNPLSHEETELLNKFRNRRKNNFYIIGTSQEISQATLNHEIAHGLFNTNPEYKKQVLKVVRSLSVKDRKLLNNFLANYSGGYHPDFWEEEGSCYLLDKRCLGRNGVSSESIAKAGEKIKEIFRKFSTQ